MFNYINTNEDYLIDNSPVFETMCLPGMTEQFKLYIYIHIDPESNIRFIFVCEENSKAKKEMLDKCT